MKPSDQFVHRELFRVSRFVETLREVIAVQSAQALALLASFRLDQPPRR